MCRFASLVTGLGFAAATCLAQSIPTTSSPGALASFTLAAGPCPTFSWGAVPGAEAYELILYRLEDQSAEPRPQLVERLPGTVSTWTPDIDRCPAPAGRYGWAVRAVADGAAGEWSEVRFFGILTPQPVERVEEAIRVLEGYLEENLVRESTDSVDRDLEPGSQRSTRAVPPDATSAEIVPATVLPARDGAEPELLVQGVAAGAVAAVDPALVLGTGGIRFPDGSLQTRAAWNADGQNDLRVVGSALKPRENDVSYTVDVNGSCTYVTAGSAFTVWNTPVHLPQGTRVNTLRMYYYDTSASNTTAWFTVYDLYGSIVQEWSVSSSGNSGYSFKDSAAIDHVVNNSVYSYVLNWRPGVANSTIQLCGFRIFYGS